MEVDPKDLTLALELEDAVPPEETKILVLIDPVVGEFEMLGKSKFSPSTSAAAALNREPPLVIATASGVGEIMADNLAKITLLDIH